MPKHGGKHLTGFHVSFPSSWLVAKTAGLAPAQVEGTQGFLPQPEKDLERPSSHSQVFKDTALSFLFYLCAQTNKTQVKKIFSPKPVN